MLKQAMCALFASPLLNGLVLLLGPSMLSPFWLVLAMAKVNLMEFEALDHDLSLVDLVVAQEWFRWWAAWCATWNFVVISGVVFDPGGLQSYGETCLLIGFYRLEWGGATLPSPRGRGKRACFLRGLRPLRIACRVLFVSCSMCSFVVSIFVFYQFSVLSFVLSLYLMDFVF